jgi:branched-chain amino acid transport system substrate-binding protein
MMRKTTVAAAAALLACAAPLSLTAQELRIGFMTNYSGPGGPQGLHQRNGWTLGLEHEGWKKDGDPLGGVPMRVYYGDDQSKPDIAMREVDKMISLERAQIVVGFLWSHTLFAAVKPLFAAKKLVVSTVPGPSQLAGKECSPLFLSLLHQNDSVPEATGQLANTHNIRTVFALAPNYQAGKDMIAGFERTFKGKIVDQLLFKLGETDYLAEFAKVRAVKPDAVFVFAPGPMGIAFMKQWTAAGIGRDVKVYSVHTVDWLTLPAVGDAAVGTLHAQMWDPNSSDATNQRFIKEYVAKFNHMPSFFAATAYDTARLIGAGVKAAGGKVDDTLALAKTMRTVSFPTTRPGFKINPANGFPIQPHYEREVVLGADGKPTIKTLSVIYKEHKDAYWEQCPRENRT